MSDSATDKHLDDGNRPCRLIEAIAAAAERAVAASPPFDSARLTRMAAIIGRDHE